MSDQVKQSAKGSRPTLKVCGMRAPENIAAVAALSPGYMGFIFWPKSKRFVQGTLPELPDTIKKIGVVVNASHTEIEQLVAEHGLAGIQLHGQESPSFCNKLKQNLTLKYPTVNKGAGPWLIKAFSVGEAFDFKQLKEYEPCCDYFLFDTKGKLPGGNGHSFSWDLLKDYPSHKPYMLSGGIGLDSLEKLSDFLKDPAAAHCAVIDVNSTFERSDYSKDPEALAQFKNRLENLPSH